MSTSLLFPQQEVIQKQFSDVKKLFVENKLNTENLDSLKPLIDNFEIRVPFIGGFSSGKSTIINALMGLSGKKRLLATNVKPETAVASEIHYGENLSIKACCPDGQEIDISLEQFKDSKYVDSLNLVEKEGWFEIYYPIPVLKEAPHLILVDMPGWGSAVDNHKKVVDDYANRSLAYIVVVSVPEGTLHDKLRAALDELGLEKKPIILAMSKAKFKPPKDAEAVRDVVAGELEKVLKYSPKDIVMTSAAEKDISQLENALKNLEKDAKDIFAMRIGGNWINELNIAKSNISKLTNEKYKDAESVQIDIDLFLERMKESDQKLENEGRTLDKGLTIAKNNIYDSLNNAMNSGLHNWSERALQGADVSQDILETTRKVIADGIRNEFMPLISKYTSNVIQGLPEDFDGGLSSSVGQIDLSNIRVDSSTSTADKVKGGLAATLATVLLAIPHPAAKIGGLILGLLSKSFFSGPSDDEIRAKQQDAQAQAINNAKRELRNALSETIKKAMNSVEESLKSKVNEVKNKTKNEIYKQKKHIETMLNAKKEALQNGEAHAKAIREKAQSDIEKINMWIDEVNSNK